MQKENKVSRKNGKIEKEMSRLRRNKKKNLKTEWKKNLKRELQVGGRRKFKREAGENKKKEKKYRFIL